MKNDAIEKIGTGINNSCTGLMYHTLVRPLKRDQGVIHQTRTWSPFPQCFLTQHNETPTDV